MATENDGNGDPGARNNTVLGLEHWLNELEDHTEMLRHPFVIGIDNATMATLRDSFLYGRVTQYQCFAEVLWGTQGPATFPGYPDDSPQAVPRALALGGVGPLGPLGMSMPVPSFGFNMPMMNGPLRPPPRIVWPHVLDPSNWAGHPWTPPVNCTVIVLVHDQLPHASSPDDRCDVAA
jgi:hypothetical protein